jgi:hypothetical protein
LERFATVVVFRRTDLVAGHRTCPDIQGPARDAGGRRPRATGRPAPVVPT